jgi:Zn-dependent protease with chaperone function
MLIVVSPIIASMIRLALSRQREYLADASGASSAGTRTRWQTRWKR